MLGSAVTRSVRGSFRPKLASTHLPGHFLTGSVARASLVRFYSDKKNLLDDDMLSRAGLDPKNVEKPQGKPQDGQTEGDKPNEGSSAESEEQRKKWESTARAPRSESRQVERRTRRAWLGTAAFAAIVIAYLVRPFDDQEKEQHKDVTNTGWDSSGAWDRVRARYFTTVDTFAAPVFDKLLPDPLPPPYDRPTLVIAVDDLLVHSEWTRKHGWRVAKRPGVDYFLGYLAMYYEVVLFSDKYQAMAAETVLKLDPMRASVSYALFREATRYDKGALVKDSNHLNRDSRKVIVLDVDPDAVKLQPDNAFLLPRWTGNADDKELIRLIPLLEWIGAQPIKDVRPIIKSYNQSPDGVINEFERRDKINRQQWAEKRKKSKGSLNSLLGLGSSQNSDMMPQDVIRMESQKNYEKFRKHVDDYGKKMVEEEEQKMKSAMNEHKMTLNKWLSGEAPSAEEIAATAAKQDHQ